MEKNYEWSNIQDLPVLPWIPDRYDIEEKLLFRSPLTLINHLYWKQLVDYEFYNQINADGDTIPTVHGYYTTSIHKLYKAFEMEIPANTDFHDDIIIRNYSRSRAQGVEQSRLENCFSRYKHDELENYIKNFYKISDLGLYCKKELESEKIKLNIEKASFDRIFVLWTIDLIVGLYRSDFEGNLSLVGFSDYYINSFPQLYPKSNIFWSDKNLSDKDFVELNYREKDFCSIYIPGMNPVKIKEVDFEDESEG